MGGKWRCGCLVYTCKQSSSFSLETCSCYLCPWCPLSWAFPQFRGRGTDLLLSFSVWDFFSSTSHLPPLHLHGNLPGLLHCYFYPCGLTIKNFLYCHFYRVWGGRGEKQASFVCLIRNHNCWLKKKVHTMRETSCLLLTHQLGFITPHFMETGHLHSNSGSNLQNKPLISVTNRSCGICNDRSCWVRGLPWRSFVLPN